MEFIKRNSVLLGVFLLSFYCVKNYLVYIPYDAFVISPLFRWNVDFLLEHLKHSFSFLDYLSLFVIQFFHTKLLATVVLSLLVTALFAVFRRFLSLFNSSFGVVNICALSIVPAVLLLTERQMVHDLIGLIIVLGTMLLLKRQIHSRKFILISVIVGLALWFLIQPFALLYLLLLPVVFWNENKWSLWRVLLFNILLMGLLYAVRYRFVHFVPDDAYWSFIRHYLTARYFYFVAILLFISLILRLSKRFKFAFICPVLVMVGLIIYDVDYIKHHSSRNSECIIKRCFIEEDWSSLLNYAIVQDQLSQTSSMCVNYALYRDNHLLDRAFLFDQYYFSNGLLPTYVLFTDDIPKNLNFFYNQNSLLLSEIYYQMGLYSMGIRIANDFLAHYKDQPHALLQLTKQFLKCGDKEAADKYAYILMQNPLYRNKVKEIYEHVKEDADMPDYSDVGLSHFPQINLEIILRQEQKNEMALQYYITYSLLNCDDTTIPFIIEKLTEYGYSDLPQDFEYLIYLTNNTNNLNNLSTDSRRLKNFLKLRGKLYSVRNAKEAKVALNADKQSYLYYYIVNTMLINKMSGR